MSGWIKLLWMLASAGLMLAFTPDYTSLAAQTTPTPTVTPLPDEVLHIETKSDTVEFAVIGDYGKAGPNAEAVAEMIIDWEPDLILTVGDNNYDVGAAETIDANVGQYYHDFIAPYVGAYGEGAGDEAKENRFFPTLGNHDWLTDDAQPYFDYFELPGNERYYTFTAGHVQFFALDGNYDEPDGIRSDSVQAEWLQDALAESTAVWKVVYFHVAPYSSGDSGSYLIMQWPFAEWGADAIIAGHDHIYERLEVDGIPYFVNGVGGGAIYAFGEILPESRFRFNRGYGAMRVIASDEDLTFEFFSTFDSSTPLDSLTLHAGTD